MTAMLDGLRVLDLANERGILCGQILADLGADVILIEPPGGSSARGLGPFHKDERDPERSLFFWSYARGKRGVVLDLERGADRARLRELARTADFLIESETPGRMAELGLDCASLARENPGLVYVSISPFGQDGPKARYAATDLTVMAASGPMYLTGDGDRAPLRVSTPQAFHFAAAEAAVAALVAHVERERSGLGQHVDVSAQQAVGLATLFRSLDAPWDQAPAERVSGGVQLGKLFMRLRYETRDGWVVLGPGFLPSTGPFLTRLVKWLDEEGLVEDPRFLAEDWGSYGIRLLFGQVEPEHWAPLDAALEQLFAARSNLEVLREAVARKLLVAPYLTLDDIDKLDHFRERDFPRELEHAELGVRVRYPGPFARFAKSPIRYGRVAPRLGEHTVEVLSESRSARTLPAPAAKRTLPLEGVKVLDLFWVLAGPAATRVLAEYGATVVHVESTRRLDTIRTIPPYKGGALGPENNACVQGANAGKLCITLDLARPEARPVIESLVRWADVVTESFAPGVVERMGLGYEALRAIKPDLIMISSCLMGQTGSLKSFAGFGNLAASVTGFQLFAGWPGRAPSGPAGAYTDYIAARYNAIAILAALEHRRRTGEGQYIDQSQAEAAFHFLAPELLDFSLNGRSRTRAGNEDLELFPHGAFPALGRDRWVAIAVRDARDWRALCEALGRADWRDDAALAGAEARRARGDAIDAAISAWTETREAGAIENELQARGVPAHAVLDMPGLYADAQLRARGHWLEIPHPMHGAVTIESSRSRLSHTPARNPERALTFGCDNRRVLGELLGLDDAAIAELEAKGVLS
jgi:crotonobetainyl-CoA:carnitine CoA-transferase CaiB-like acyl-CoA transferase